MAGNKSEYGKWSGSDDGLRTMECLRGRLLAERHASRVAKEESELMESKLVELENKLKEEIKFREKAEKRLNFLKKKLESLNLKPNLEESEQSNSSQKSAISCQSSTAESGSNPQQNPVEIPSEATKSAQTNDSSINEENAGSNSCSESDTKDVSRESSNSDLEYLNRSSSSLKYSMDVKDHTTDNSMALVPVSPPEKTPIPEAKITNKDVIEVLDTLKHIRERIQSTLETRRVMVRVGPS